MNGFSHIVETFAKRGADSILLCNYEDGMVTATPFNSKTNRDWAFAFMGDIEDALSCGYPIVTMPDAYENEPELIKVLRNHFENKG